MKFAGLLVVALAGSAAVAKDWSASTAAFNSGGYSTRAPAGAVTGFEAPEFTPGIMDNQNGWPVSGVNLPWATIATSNPHSGAQHAHLENDSTLAAGTNRIAFSPTTVLPANTPDVTSMWFFISGSGGADYDFIGQAPSQGFLSWRVKMNFQGGIFVLDDTGEGLGYEFTGVTWTPGQWNNLCVEFDAAANAGAGSINYLLNGTLIYTSVTGTVAGTSVEQVLALHDNWQNPGEFMDWDDISSDKIPTPGALAVLGLGGMVAARRRRA